MTHCLQRVVKAVAVTSLESSEAPLLADTPGTNLTWYGLHRITVETDAGELESLDFAVKRVTDGE